MMNRFAMQQEVYHAAAKYHGALAEYSEALHPDNESHSLKEEEDKCLSAGREYGVRLQGLLDYALTTGASEIDEQEVQRIRRLIELLDLEMEQIRSR